MTRSFFVGNLVRNLPLQLLLLLPADPSNKPGGVRHVICGTLSSGGRPFLWTTLKMISDLFDSLLSVLSSDFPIRCFVPLPAFSLAIDPGAMLLFLQPTRKRQNQCDDGQLGQIAQEMNWSRVSDARDTPASEKSWKKCCIREQMKIERKFRERKKQIQGGEQTKEQSKQKEEEL